MQQWNLNLLSGRVVYVSVCHSVSLWFCTFDGLLQVLQVKLVLTHQTFFKLSELLGLLLHLQDKPTRRTITTFQV